MRGAEIIERLERDAVGVPLVPGDGAGPKPRAQARHRPGARRQMRQQMRRHRDFDEAAAGLMAAAPTRLRTQNRRCVR